MLLNKETENCPEKDQGDLLPRREISCNRIKKAAVTAALDIRLARMLRSPERCARNLMELGLNAYPDRIPKEEELILLQSFMEICRAKDVIKARELFFASFLT